MTAAALVRRFYDEVWNRADEAVAREILRQDFRFRGSLGPERRGPDGFIDYLRATHRALGGYVCIIDDLIATATAPPRAMTFKGVHRVRSSASRRPAGRSAGPAAPSSRRTGGRSSSSGSSAISTASSGSSAPRRRAGSSYAFGPCSFLGAFGRQRIARRGHAEQVAQPESITI